MRLYWIILRTVCYLGLAFVLSGVGALLLVSLFGTCPRLDEGEVSCTAPLYQSLGQWGVGVVLITAFTGLPGLLALGGIVFAIRDLIALIRRRRRAG